MNRSHLVAIGALAALGFAAAAPAFAQGEAAPGDIVHRGQIASAADGTRWVLDGDTGLQIDSAQLKNRPEYTSHKWIISDAGGDHVSIKNAKTNKCAATELVEPDSAVQVRPCQQHDDLQKWKVEPGDGGTLVITPKNDPALAVSVRELSKPGGRSPLVLKDRASSEKSRESLFTLP